MVSFIIDQLFIMGLLFALLAGTVLPRPPEVRDRLAAAADQAERSRILKSYNENPAIQARQVNNTRFWLVAAVLYHIGLRRTRGGTVGHRLTGIRLIDCHNEPPALRVLVKRFFSAMLLAGPFGASYFLCMKNPKRQSMHDRWCNTWVVRSDATPAGPGILVHRMKVLSSWVIRYLDIEPMPEGQSGAPNATGEAPIGGQESSPAGSSF